MDKAKKESMKTKKESMTVEIFRWAAGTTAFAALILSLLILGFGALATGVASPITIPLVISAIVCTGLALTSAGVSESLAAKHDGKPYSMSQNICLLLAGIFTLGLLSGLLILFGGVPILWPLEIIAIAAITSMLLGITFAGIFDYLRQVDRVGPSSQENPGEIPTGVNPSLSKAMASTSAVVIAKPVTEASKSEAVIATPVTDEDEKAHGNIPVVIATSVIERKTHNN